MNDKNAPVRKAAATPEQPGRAARKTSMALLGLIAFSLLCYFVADRLTPYSTQARVQAFVVPVSAEVAGSVSKVFVKNNDEVKRGSPLFELDASQYRIALDRAKADYASVASGVNASLAGVESAKASLRAAQAGRLKAEQDASRQEQLYAEDAGAISVRRLEGVRADREKSRAQVVAAEADVVRAVESVGGIGADNAKLASARSAIAKAELDLRRTLVAAPARGLVTDLRTDVGQFVQTGSPSLTLIAIHDLWISAEMTENNLGNVKPGDEVGILLDAMPGTVLKGRVRSIGSGVSSGKEPPAGSLPEIDNSRDWLRQAQRFPVAVEFERSELARLRGVRVGGQADVIIYTEDAFMTRLLGRLYIRLMSLLSYVY
ncbi:MAG TPA: HlyD family secretion protein [Arenimonas sp.]|nr:HlyD family secretion protein [Arenimonas sp.]